jgi:quercetin dioxygenase-like cupin family protein
MKEKIFGRRRWSFTYLLCMTVCSALWLLHAQQKQNSNFTGTVTRLEGDPINRISRYRFEPGARTKWHVHVGGQIVLVEEGVGRHQIQGEGVQELHAGDVVYAPPGKAHWHGAAPDQSAVLYSVARGNVMWMDEVSEKDYTAKPAPRK